jgi:hypothetical protein
MIDLNKLKEELEEWQVFYQHPADEKNHAFFTTLISAVDQLEAAQQRIAELEASFDELAAAVGWTKERCEQAGDSPVDCANGLANAVIDHYHSLKAAEAEIAKRDLAAGVPVGSVTGYTVNGCVVSRSRLSIGDKVYSAAQPAVLPWHVDSCSNCGSKLLSWDTTVVKNTAVQDGLLKLNEVSGLFYLGCDECYETLLKVSADDVANHLNNAKAQGFTADGD